MSEEVQEVKGDSSYQFFSESDYDPKTGRIKSEYPSWYDPRLLQDMEDEINEKEVALQNGWVPRESIPTVQESLAQLKKGYDRVKNMTMIDDARNDRDKLNKAFKNLKQTISDELPRRMECDRNIVDSNMEYEKMHGKPRYKLEGELMKIGKACNIRIEDGKTDGYGLHKMFKIVAKNLGEYADVESLRK